MVFHSLVYFHSSDISPNMVLWWQYVIYYYNFSVLHTLRNDEFRFFESFGMDGNVERVFKLYWLPVKRLGSTLLWTINTILIAIIRENSNSDLKSGTLLLKMTVSYQNLPTVSPEIAAFYNTGKNNPAIIASMKI